MSAFGFMVEVMIFQLPVSSVITPGSFCLFDDDDVNLIQPR